MRIMRAGRARRRIKNEIPNTRTHGYEFGPNFGHGSCKLSDVLAELMMLVFLIHRVEQFCWALSEVLREKAGRLKYLWEDIRSQPRSLRIPDREILYFSIADPGMGPARTCNYSS